MDLLSIFGIITGILAIVIGQFLEGGHISALMNGPALLIVLGGTIGAVMIETPKSIFKRALTIIFWVIFPPRLELLQHIDKIVSWNNVTRKSGLLGLEAFIEHETDEFTQISLDLLLDGSEPKTIRSVLEVDLENRVQKELQAAKVFESMGGYSPTIGIIGAVLGLIHVMSNLSDPSKLGSGIAVAFVATIYGVGLANLIFLPMASKLHRLIVERAKISEMLLEGVVSIAEGNNSRILRLKLLGFSK